MSSTHIHSLVRASGSAVSYAHSKKLFPAGFRHSIFRLVSACICVSLCCYVVLWSHGSYAASFNGPWVQGALVTGQAEPGEKIIFDGRELKLTDAGHFAFGLGRDAPAKIKVAVKSPDGILTEKYFEVRQREYVTQRIEGVEQKHVTPPKEVTDRIKREAAAVGSARKLNADTSDFLSIFIWPASGPITGVYGSQRYYNGVPRSPHYGLDIAGPTGAPVVAPAGGLVTFANDDLYYSGGTLILDHGHGISSTFIHLSKIEVAKGQRVEQGDLIARIGASGRATGPHLDWRMNWFGERLDPQLLFPEGSKPDKPVPIKSASAN